MLEEGEKTPEPLQEMPTSPPPSITTHSYTATSCVFPSSSSAALIKRRAGRNEDITRLSIGNKPELYADITVSPPTPGVCVCVCVCVCVRVCVRVGGGCVCVRVYDVVLVSVFCSAFQVTMTDIIALQ